MLIRLDSTCRRSEAFRSRLPARGSAPRGGEGGGGDENAAEGEEANYYGCLLSHPSEARPTRLLFEGTVLDWRDNEAVNARAVVLAAHAGRPRYALRAAGGPPPDPALSWRRNMSGASCSVGSPA